MERRRAVGLNTIQLKQPFPGTGGEHQISIANQDFRQAMDRDHVLEEHRRHIRGCHIFCCRNEEHLFCQAVHHHHDSIMVVAKGLVDDLVERHAQPVPSIGEREGDGEGG